MMFVLVATVVGPLLTIETSAAAAATAMLQELVAVPDPESRALVLKGKLPATVGVPVIAPVEGVMGPKPVGSDPVIENV